MTVRLTVDGIDVTMAQGATVLDAVNHARIALPQLCKDPDRPPLGTCRTCLVNIDGMPGTPTACSTLAVDGMVVRTDDPDVARVRRGVLQLTIDMLPEGDEHATGDLAHAATSHGLTRGRFLPAAGIVATRTHTDASNPFWVLDHTRCILCERCVDACQHLQHISAIALLDRGAGSEIGVFGHGTVAGSNCTSCGSCVAACPTGAIRAKAPVAAVQTNRQLPYTPAVRQVETVCPYCGVGCGVVLDLDERGDILRVDDVPGNESSQGMLCVKGRFGLGFVHAPDRLTAPLIRSEASGELEPATWDEALDLIADRFVAHRGRFGAFGSAKATNEDGYLVQKFARVVMGTNNVDHCARLCHSSSMAGMLEMLGSGSTTNSYTDFEQAGCLLIAGSDTDVNHPVIAARIRKGVAENGVRLIVVNPRRIRLCEIADVWLRPKPGTDVALFNGLARIALDEGLWDEAFVAERTEGFDAWRTSLAPYHPAYVASVTGIAEADLRLAARLFARPERGNSSMLWGMGITQHTRGTANVQAMVNLALVTGQIGKPGSGLAPLRGQNNVQGCCDMAVLPNTLPGYQGLTPDALATFGRVWGGNLPERPGLTLTEMIDAAHRGELDALYICGENPMLTEANLNHTREALERLSFLVVQTAFPNETTALAHVVLPVAVFAEKDGTFTNSERRIQRVRKALEPPGDARADWEVTGEIARRVSARLGLDGVSFDYPDPGAIWAEIAALVPSMAGISYERMEQGGIQWPCPTTEHPGTPLLFTETFPRGKATFVIVDQGAPAAELPDPAFPLILNTGRVLFHWHGGDMTRRVKGLVESYPRVEVSVHPVDAERLALGDGAPVRVTSRRGEIVAMVRVTDVVRQGEVFIPFVQLNGAAANLLTNNVFDPRSRIPEYKVCAVRLVAA